MDTQKSVWCLLSSVCWSWCLAVSFTCYNLICPLIELVSLWGCSLSIMHKAWYISVQWGSLRAGDIAQSYPDILAESWLEIVNVESWFRIMQSQPTESVLFQSVHDAWSLWMRISAHPHDVTSEISSDSFLPEKFLWKESFILELQGGQQWDVMEADSDPGVWSKGMKRSSSPTLSMLPSLPLRTCATRPCFKSYNVKTLFSLRCDVFWDRNLKTSCLHFVASWRVFCPCLGCSLNGTAPHKACCSQE